MKPCLQLLLLGTFVFSSFVWGAKLGGQLKPAEVQIITQKVGFGSASRLMRSAEAYPTWAGLKVGLELPITPAGGIGEYGDGKGTIGGVLLGPRLYLSKGLADGFEITFNFFQPLMLNTPGTFGALLKYCIVTEERAVATTAAYIGYTSISSFTSSLGSELAPTIAYKGTDLEAGMLISRDYVKLKPFAGLGILFAKGEIDPELTLAENSMWQGTLHLFLGSEFEWPMNFTAQIDFMNLSMMGSLAFTFKF